MKTGITTLRDLNPIPTYLKVATMEMDSITNLFVGQATRIQNINRHETIELRLVP